MSGIKDASYAMEGGTADQVLNSSEVLSQSEITTCMFIELKVKLCARFKFETIIHAFTSTCCDAKAHACAQAICEDCVHGS